MILTALPETQTARIKSTISSKASTDKLHIYRPTFIVHPHEMFLETVNLSFAADDPVVVYNDCLLYTSDAADE